MRIFSKTRARHMIAATAALIAVGVPPIAALGASPAAAAGVFVPLSTPQRLVDTRTGVGAVSVLGGGIVPAGPLQLGTVYAFVAGRSGAVPQGADAYAFNVTVALPAGTGYLQMWSCNGSHVSTSVINYQPGADTANGQIVTNPAGARQGQICMETFGSATNVIVDATGYFASDLVAVAPARLYDSRVAGNGPIPANGTRAFQVAGVAGIPARGVKAVAINLTAILPTGRGYLSVFPDDVTRPNTSNINYVTGTDKADFAVVALPADGDLDLYSAGSAVNVAVDVIGYWGRASPLQTQAPVRLLDTRRGAIGGLTGPLTVDTAHNFTVTGAPGSGAAPAGAVAVFGNLTAVSPSTGRGYLQLFPSGASIPATSTVNYVGSSPIGNFTVSGIGAAGQLSLTTHASTVDALYDLDAWYPSGS